MASAGSFQTLILSLPVLDFLPISNNGFNALPSIEFGNGYNTSIGSQAFCHSAGKARTRTNLGGAISWLRGRA